LATVTFAKPTTIAAVLAACALALAIPSAVAEEQTIIFFGDSITAGYGLENPDEAFPGLIGARIEEAGLPYRVVNAGLSGETTAGGLRRVDWILRQPCDVFVLGLGGNDGLRGIDPAEIERNLVAMLAKVRAKNPDAALVVAGMQIFPSMGEDYRNAYQAAFPAAAGESGATLIPFLLEGVGGVPELNLGDGIHPTAEGHRIVAENVWRVLGPALTKRAPPER
jgi:acyl-CoA thioesterase-1